MTSESERCVCAGCGRQMTGRRTPGDLCAACITARLGSLPPPGPFDTDRAASLWARRAGGPPRPGWSILSESQRQELLTAVCERAGVTTTGYEQHIIAWLAGWEDSITAVVAGLIARAGQAGTR